MQNKSDIEQASGQSPHDKHAAELMKKHDKFCTRKGKTHDKIKKIKYPKDPTEPLPV